jgi:hypothetical protein
LNRPFQCKDIPDGEVLLAYERSSNENAPYPYIQLMEKYNCPFKVAYQKMQRLSDGNYVDYGVSLRCGWLTDKGKEALKKYKDSMKGDPHAPSEM